MPERTVWAIALLTLVVGAVLGAGLAMSVLDDGSDEQNPNDPTATGPSADRLDPALLLANESSVEQFGTAEAFKEYVRAGQQQDGRIRVREGRLQGGVEDEAMEDGGNGDGARRGGDDGGDAVESADPAEFTGGSGSEGPDRVGETNVQVEGFDEPDVVKTDGANFYYSPVVGGHHPRPVIEDDDHRRSEEPDPSTHVIDLSEPADPAAIANVDASGRMLQTGDTQIGRAHV